MLKQVEIYEPVTTQEMVDRENEMIQETVHSMSDEVLTRHMDDLAEKGGYSNPSFLIAWDEWHKRHEKRGE